MKTRSALGSIVFSASIVMFLIAATGCNQPNLSFNQPKLGC